MKLFRIILVLVVVSAIAVACVALGNQYFASSQDYRVLVKAPDQWRWVCYGITLEGFKILAGEPDQESLPPPGIDYAFSSLRYESEFEGVFHSFLFDNSGSLRFCDWYEEGIPVIDELPVPEPLVEGFSGSALQGVIPMKWAGQFENGFEVSVEIEISNGEFQGSGSYFTRQNSCTHRRSANSGRWRVRGLGSEGAGPWSEFIEFEHL